MTESWCEIVFESESEDDELYTKRCNRCNVALTLEFFKKKRMGYTKNCIKCLETAKRTRDRNKCVHGRQKSTCRDCDGSQICIHKRRKSQCVECDGSQICVHKKQKSTCRDCDGSQICVHKRHKSKCKDCGGSQICEHKRQKHTCKDCGGSGICVHGRQKSQCKDCGGSGICIHKRVRSQCKDCDGGGICVHKRQRSQCKDCDGSLVCIHKKLKPRCKSCTNPKIVLINRWISDSKQSDKKRDKYNPEKYVTRQWLEEKLDECVSTGTRCHYCEKTMDLIEYGPDLITIERLNNERGHNIDNCVFACFGCNRKHQSKTVYEM